MLRLPFADMAVAHNCKFADVQADGKTASEDGSTDMGTFGARGFIGYSKYCLAYNPRCKCKGSADPPASTCCEPDAKEGNVGAQAFDEKGVPQVRA